MTISSWQGRSVMRAGSGSALVVIGALHLLWCAGGSWPARDRSTLAVVVSGSPSLPGAVPCAVVGGGLLAAGLALATGRPAGPVRFLRAAVGSGLAARALVGGRVAARAVGLPDPDPVFLSWDRRCYRPLCAALALGVLADVRSAEPVEGPVPHQVLRAR